MIHESSLGDSRNSVNLRPVNLAAMQNVMLAITAARATKDVLGEIVESVAHCPNVALARIWLVESRDDDRGRQQWLQLAASAGRLRSPGADPRRLDGHFSRFQLGDRKIGRVAASGEGVLLADLTLDDAWICNPEWVRAESVVSFAAQPLVFRGEVLGVLAFFDRSPITTDDFAWLRTFADHAAVAISNARAFEEIDRLRARLEQDNTYLREEITAPFGDILGRSPALDKVLRQIEMVAPTDANVLVLGESGVGKELVARAIHDRSRRRERPLVKVNCAAIPAELFESEFFGHQRGAFTGALRDRAGRFEIADGGTLFLDEVGEIPLAQQPKLLRVLQEGTFERVGEGRTRKTDVRVIAATNRDLSREATEGRFRPDLFYRLSVFPVEVPPLRMRREDIPDLAAHFVANAAKRLGVAAPRITNAAVRTLQEYHWPGNVRELQHVVERAVILSPRGTLHVPELVTPASTVVTPGAGQSEGDAPDATTLADLKRRERDVIAAALERAGGKVSGAGGAAELLGLRPTTLESKLRALGLKGGKSRARATR